MKRPIGRVLLGALLATQTFVSQATNPNASGSVSTAQHNPVELVYNGASIKAGQIIVKVKPEFRNQCSLSGVAESKLSSALEALQVSSIQKKFPAKSAPAVSLERNAVQPTDLSLIYSIRLPATVSIAEAISKIMASGTVVYAEPVYLNRMDYTPNDPQIASQYQNTKINLYNAWDVWKGDSNTVVGIVDSGTDWDHPDLAASIKYNYADPIDGSDNDNDGFIDNYRGWDVSENDNDPMVVNSDHGSHVSGCAAAVVDNNTGVAGPAFRCKFLPVKVSLDASTSAIDNGYDGIVYAADHGANVINCSWGRTGGISQFEQDVITYATIDKNALVVAAAGNTYMEEEHYPGSYKYVLCVAATTSSDSKAGFSTYGYNVDLCAPGDQIYSTVFDDSYTSYSGTSMASPIAAGCAAIVKSRFPSMTALQVGEQLRITCDDIYSASGNTAYRNKLGSGRINLFEAITDSVSPGVVVDNLLITDNQDDVFIIGDTLYIRAIFKNLLRPTANFTAILSSTNPVVTVVASGYTAGVIASMDTASNYASLYKVVINPSAGSNTEVRFKLSMQDGTWTDFYAFRITVNVDYINIAINDIGTSITSKGLIGYNASQQNGGLGFMYMGGATILYEMGLMVGATGTQVSDNIRGDGSTYDEDFASVVNVVGQEPGVYSDFDAHGTFRDNGSTSVTPISVFVTHRAFAWMSAADRKYVIVEYTIRNTNGGSLSNLYAGLFADWDIPAYGNNKCTVDNSRRMGYAWSTDAAGLYAGMKLLTPGSFNNYSIDNISGGNGGLDMFDGYSTVEKYQSLSTPRQDGGTSLATGNDIIQVVSTGPFNLANGDSVTVAFALIAGEDLSMIQASADAAQIKYDNLSTGLVEIPMAGAFSMTQSYPNPASEQSAITFVLPQSNSTELSLYNTMGEKVKTIVSERLNGGKYTVTVDVSKFPAGNYFYRLQSGTNMKTLPLTIVR